MSLKKLLQKIRDLAFSRKITLVYVFSLAVIIIAMTSHQINSSIQFMEKESIKNLGMLTNQVVLNFAENQDSLSYSLYAKLRNSEIPGMMGAAAPGSNYTTLQNALSETISSSQNYDYVLIELVDGTRLEAKRAQPVVSQITHIRKCSHILLDGKEGNRGFTRQWVRMGDDDVFYIMDVYDTKPLKYVGKVVYHMESVGFTLTDTYSSTGMLFFDSEGTYLTSVGMELSETDRQKLSAMWNKPKKELSSNDFFLSKSSRDSWIAIGFTTKDAYYQMRRETVYSGIIFGVVGLTCGTLLILLLLHTLNLKMRELKKSIAYVSEGQFGYQIEIRDNDDITQISKAFNSMTRRIAELMEEVVEKERLRRDADFQILEYQYRALQTQIRPHFIYNAFETVNAMAKIKGETEIVEIVKRISKYFRNITVNTTQQFLTIQQEFDSLRSYTEVYRYIHGEALNVEFSAKPEALDAYVPTMLVQPLVENAMEHGLRSPEEMSQIIVHAYIRNNSLNITVKDNGAGLTAEQEKILNSDGVIPSVERGGVGLGNVRKRLALIYGGEASLSVRNRPEGGTISKIIMPVSYTEPSLLGDETGY